MSLQESPVVRRKEKKPTTRMTQMLSRQTNWKWRRSSRSSRACVATWQQSTITSNYRERKWNMSKFAVFVGSQRTRDAWFVLKNLPCISSLPRDQTRERVVSSTTTMIVALGWRVKIFQYSSESVKVNGRRHPKKRKRITRSTSRSLWPKKKKQQPTKKCIVYFILINVNCSYRIVGSSVSSMSRMMTITICVKIPGCHPSVKSGVVTRELN